MVEGKNYARTIYPRKLCIQSKNLGHSVPWAVYPLDDAALGYFVP
jgi:hypothetical protein